MAKHEPIESVRRMCGAKTRAGHPCKLTPVPGKKRCRYHGGLSTGPKVPARPFGNQRARQHGIYAEAMTDEERALFVEIDVDNLDHEIRMIKVQLRRAWRLKQLIDGNPGDPQNDAGMQVSEISQLRRTDERRGGRGAEATTHTEHHVVRRRVDVDAIADKLLGRLGSLIRTRAELSGHGAGETLEARGHDLWRMLGEMEEKTAGGDE